MVRSVLLAFVLTWSLLGSRSVHAQTSEPAPYQSMAEDERDFWETYRIGRALLLRERYGDAAAVFELLERTAPKPEHRRWARELAMIARALEGEHEALRPDSRRTSDELSLLYSSAFVYGFGTSAWVALQTEPRSFAGAVLPFAILTTASVGGVAAADGYRPFPRGVPHGISGGLYLGFMEGVSIVGFQYARAARLGEPQWSSARVSTILWSSATAGAIIGGVAANSEHPYPGNVSYVVSSSVWGGLVSGLAGAALQPAPGSRAETGFIAALAGQNLGLLAGLFTVPEAPVSVARVRLTDIGGLGGGLLGSGLYAAFANQNANPRLGFGASALGASAGLGLTWWLTQGMRPPEPRARPIDSVTQSLRPVVVPTEGGVTLGIGGSL